LLNVGVRKREVFGWAMYDFANSGYTTVMLTAVFGAHFVGGVAGNACWAAMAWTGALALSEPQAQSAGPGAHMPDDGRCSAAVGRFHSAGGWHEGRGVHAPSQ